MNIKHLIDRANLVITLHDEGTLQLTPPGDSASIELLRSAVHEFKTELSPPESIHPRVTRATRTVINGSGQYELPAEASE